MAKPSLASLTLLLVLALPGCGLLSQDKTGSVTVTLEPGQRSVLSFDVDQGSVLTVTASVVGAQSVDIGIWLEDAAGKIVVHEKRGHSVELRYGAVISGQHHIVINNGYSLLTGKVVSVTTKVER